ncbi:MAG TPA: CHASE2 domain-containing protein [Oscillatoriales cyanobacterium M59_W2019_021]|nr:CHASE2 domain-containing protein [Oscillatoriales cyanobacterium M59_W2019_021]
MWQKLSQILRRERVVWKTAAIVAAAMVLLNLTGCFQLLEWAALDSFFRWRPVESADDRIVIVGIHESDIDRLGQWPMSDRQLARLLEKIKAQQPSAIGLDIFRDLPVEPGHAQLLEIYRSTSNLVGIEKVSGQTVAPPHLLSQQGQVAMADLVVDADGKVRRGLVSLVDGEGRLRLSLGAMLALQSLEKRGIVLQEIDRRSPAQPVRLGRAVFRRFQSSDGSYIRTQATGYQILLNFRGFPCRDTGSPCPFRMVSMAEVLDDRLPPDLMRDRLVFVGTTAPSVGDVFPTPYTRNPSTRMTGVEIHAHLASQILSGALDGRSSIRTLPDPLEWLWIFGWSGCGAACGSRFLQRRRGTIVGLSIAMVGAISGSYLAFLGGWWLPGFLPFLAIGGSGVGSIAYVLFVNLQLSYRKLEEYAQTLELKVRERTRELQRSEAALQAANRELQRLVSIDSLTQIANRRRFDEYLDREWQRGVRERLRLSIMLCDVDYFKIYNDTYGHPAGDRCLQAVASAIARAVKRPADLAARYGGEEFAIVLPNTDFKGAVQVAQLIQQEVERLQIPHESSPVSPYVTLSLGIACQIPSAQNSPKALVVAADRALYRAKERGRNTYYLDEMSVL